MAQVIGIYPDPTKAIIEGRLELCETVGVHCASAVRDTIDVDSIKATISALVARNEQVLSAALRKQDGELLAKSGDHDKHWQGADPETSTPMHMRIPIVRGSERWGTVEIAFTDLYGEGFWAWLSHPIVSVMAFVGISGFVAFVFYLKRTLKQLNPQSVIPERIQAMLNTLAEGLVVLDKNEYIVMVNETFAQYMGQASEKLQGRKLSSLKWTRVEAAAEGEEALPWLQTLKDGSRHVGVAMRSPNIDEKVSTLTVNTAPVLGGDGKTRGVLATFDDVTAVEQKNVQLNDMISMLKKSRDQITKQNEELQRLATRDVLTGCLNRRSLFDQFDAMWKMAEEQGTDIGCIMLDVDKFKSVNDTHGHSKGDDVLREVAKTLLDLADEMHLVCRYGGEEFTILMPHSNVDEAGEMAEKFRAEIEVRHCGGLDITSSFGVSAKSLGAASPQDMLDQADKSLYAAKRGGRNKVVQWNTLPADAPSGEHESPAAEAEPEEKVAQQEQDDGSFIPFQAVTGLLAALSQRDPATAQHSRRVADLCVMVAKETMSARDCFVLETAALMHDIGKLGIPESILQKPGPLTEEEQHVMRLHDEMGVAIVNATFASRELTEIIETHHSWYCGHPTRPGLPLGEDIPLKARMLSIADAFDAMVSDRPYRDGMPNEDAFKELRRCSGTQFDAGLAERFIEVVTARFEAGYDYHGSAMGNLDSITPRLTWQLDQAIDKLSQAYQAKDFTSLSLLAGQLKLAAGHMGLGKIVELAQDVERSVSTEADLEKVSRLAGELLGMCQTGSPEEGGAIEEAAAGSESADGVVRQEGDGDTP